MATYTLISSNVLTTSAASVTFSSIPADYTDLVLRISARTIDTATNRSVRVLLNGSTSNNSWTLLYGTGSVAGSTNATADTVGIFGGYISHDGDTSATFGSVEIYIPNYLSNTNKPLSGFGASENNATAAYMGVSAGLRSSTTAVSSLLLQPTASTSFASGSSFYLYGLSNA